jgi:two-component system CheB/CheR fusion protein
VDQPVLILSSDFTVISANPAFLDYFKLAAEETHNVSIFELDAEQWKIPSLRTLLERAKRDGGKNVEAKIEHTFRSVGPRRLLFKACRLYQQKGPGQVILAIRELKDEAPE